MVWGESPCASALKKVYNRSRRVAEGLFPSCRESYCSIDFGRDALPCGANGAIMHQDLDTLTRRTAEEAVHLFHLGYIYDCDGITSHQLVICTDWATSGSYTLRDCNGRRVETIEPGRARPYKEGDTRQNSFRGPSGDAISIAVDLPQLFLSPNSEDEEDIGLLFWCMSEANLMAAETVVHHACFMRDERASELALLSAYESFFLLDPWFYNREMQRLWGYVCEGESVGSLPDMPAEYRRMAKNFYLSGWEVWTEFGSFFEELSMTTTYNFIMPRGLSREYWVEAGSQLIPQLSDTPATCGPSDRVPIAADHAKILGKRVTNGNGVILMKPEASEYGQLYKDGMKFLLRKYKLGEYFVSTDSIGYSSLQTKKASDWAFPGTDTAQQTKFDARLEIVSLSTPSKPMVQFYVAPIEDDEGDLSVEDVAALSGANLDSDGEDNLSIV